MVTMGYVTKNIYGVWLLNLNWGYQVGHGNLVLAAIHDTQGGPHRTEECSQRAKAIYELLCRIYERLYQWGKPTHAQLGLLMHIIKGSITDEYHRYGIVNVHTARALIRRGIIKSINRDPWLSRYYRDYRVLDNNGDPLALWEEK